MDLFYSVHNDLPASSCECQRCHHTAVLALSCDTHVSDCMVILYMGNHGYPMDMFLSNGPRKPMLVSLLKKQGM